MQKLAKKLLLAGLILEGSALTLGLISLLFLRPIGLLMSTDPEVISTMIDHVFLFLLPWLLQSLIAVGMALLAFFVISAQLNNGGSSLGMEIFYVIYALALRYAFPRLFSLLFNIIYSKQGYISMAAYTIFNNWFSFLCSPFSAIGMGLLLVACGVAIVVKRSPPQLPGYPMPGQNINYPPINNYRP